MSQFWKAHLALFAVALIYGANFSIAKLVLNGGYMAPQGFILLRVLSGVAAFFLASRFFIRQQVARKDMPLLALCGLFGVAINQMCFFAGLKLTSPIHAALIMTTTPILVLAVSWALVRERVTWRRLGGIFTGMAGAVLLISGGRRIGFEGDGLWGDLLVLANAISYAIYLVLVKKLMARYHPLTVVYWVFLFALVGVLPFGAGELAAVGWTTFTPVIWWSVIYVLLFVTILTYWFNAYALTVVSPSVVSIYIYLQPLLAAGISLLWENESMNWNKAVSGILIFAGVYLVGRRV